jgi:hypothetical protein
MDIWFEMAFLGPLSLPALEQALEVVAQRHPLLGSRVEEIGGRLCWVPGPTSIPLARIGPEQVFRPQPLDPRTGQGIRFYLVERSPGCSLFMQVHHACSDGTAARLILHDFSASYAQLTDPQGQHPPLSRLEPSRLLGRGRIEAASPVPVSSSLRSQLLDILRFLFPWPQSVAPHPGGSPVGRPFAKRVLDPGESERVFERARRSGGGKLHELALSDLFDSLAGWQRDHHRGRPSARLRILIPMDLRQLADRRLPSCNRVTFAFLTRRLDQCGPDLSQALKAEHDYIRHYRTDLDFLRGLEFARDHRLLPMLLRLPISLSSAVLSNMGTVTPVRGFGLEKDGVRLGDALCHHASGASPVRSGTLASFSLCSLGGRLAIGLRCARPEIGEQAESNLLDRFTRRLLG